MKSRSVPICYKVFQEVALNLCLVVTKDSSDGCGDGFHHSSLIQ